MRISQKNLLFLLASASILSIAKFFNLIPNFIGGLLLLVYSLLLWLGSDPILKYFKIPAKNFAKAIYLLAYHSISLSILYYTIGLTSISLSVWSLFNLAIISCFYFKKKTENIKIKIKPELLSSKDYRDPEFWIIAIILVGLICYFFLNPVIDGIPSPWDKYFLLSSASFLLVSFLLITRLLKGKGDHWLAGWYFLLIIGVIAMRYVLSYGYDTLIHQGSLQYIEQYGRITPLTPFYVGQYVLEVYIYKFSGLSFTFLERWLGPASFLGLLFFGGRYFLNQLKLNHNFLLIPISVLLLIPDIFTYTSPYALSLLWGIMAVLFIALFLIKRKTTDLRLSITCALVSCFIHPFVGLNILVWSIGLYFLRKSEFAKIKNKVWLAIIFIISATAVILAFIAYNWLKDNGLTIYNPLSFIANFANIFTDPVWYLRDHYAWWLGLIYFYEKILFFIVFFLVLYWPIKKIRGAKEIIILAGISTLISAWLFVSSFRIDNYFYGDQANYGYRLIQVAKWFLWPVILIMASLFFDWLKKIKNLQRYIVIILISLLLTISWYLTYPRQDAISHMNVNSIRQIDYQAIKTIYKDNYGKNGYLVLSNQIFGAGAILKYGFGPYYQLDQETVFYYSLPWGSTLSNIYNKIMTAEADNIDSELLQLKNIGEKMNITKFYFVYTDAWSPSPKVIEQLNRISSKRWDINQKIYIFLIENLK